MSPSYITVYNGKALFTGVDSAHQVGLWVTDGTVAGTRELFGIAGANASRYRPF